MEIVDGRWLRHYTYIPFGFLLYRLFPLIFNGRFHCSRGGGRVCIIACRPRPFRVSARRLW